MQSRNLRSLFFAVSLGLGTLAAASATPLTLGQAVDAAFQKAQRTPLIQAFENESAAIREQAASLVAGDPALTLSNLNDRLDNNRGYSEWEMGVELPLWLPGQRDARNRLADTVAQQATALSRLLRLETAGQVREAVWDEAIANGRLRLAEAALDSARSLEATVERRTRAGELARLDLLLARQETASAEAELQQAGAEREQALAHLEHLTGLNTPPQPMEEMAAPDTEYDLNHPRLQLAAMDSARARAERDRTLTEGRDNPTLSIGGKTQRDSRDRDYEQLLALEIRLPLGLSSQAAPRQARSEREFTEKQLEYRQVSRELEHQRTAARLALNAERHQVLAADALRLSRRAFELGETGLLQLVQAMQRSLETDLNLALRRLEQGRAIARYNQALGMLPE